MGKCKSQTGVDKATFTESSWLGKYSAWGDKLLLDSDVDGTRLLSGIPTQVCQRIERTLLILWECYWRRKTYVLQMRSTGKEAGRFGRQGQSGRYTRNDKMPIMLRNKENWEIVERYFTLILRTKEEKEKSRRKDERF